MKTKIYHRLIGLLSIFLLAGSGQLYAQTYTVTQSVDDGSNGTLRWAINQAVAATSDVTINFSGVTTINIASELSITGTDNHKITIDGGGTVTINASNSGYRCIYKYGDKNLILKGLTFSNFNNDLPGAVINATYGSTTFNNVTFLNNRTTHYIGLIQLQVCPVYFLGETRFDGNSVTNPSFANYLMTSGGCSQGSPSTGNIVVVTNNMYNNVYWDASVPATATSNILTTPVPIPITYPAPATDPYTVTSGGDNNVLGTLRYAINNANNDSNPVTITIAVSTVNLLSECVINNRNTDLIINGNCGATIQGNGIGSYRAFTNNVAGANLILKGLTIRNFSKSDNGGAINSGSGTKLTLENVNLINNKNTGTDTSTESSNCLGGSLYANNATITFNNRVYFEQNGSENGQGGACYFINSTLNVNAGAQITFLNNSAYSSGGAVYAGYSPITQSASSSFVFTGNKLLTTTLYPGQGGGAIYIGGDDKYDCKLYNMTFTSNQAINGGAIFLANKVNNSNPNDFSNPSLTLYDCSFSSNKAVQAASTDIADASPENTGSGGAIYSLGKLTIDAQKTDGKTIFTNNTANYSGGAVQIAGVDVKVNNAVFAYNVQRKDDNSLAGGGGAMCVAPLSKDYSVPNIITISNTTFNNNFAALGGAIMASDPLDELILTYNEGKEYTDVLRFFANQSLHTTTGVGNVGYGGAVYVAGNITIKMPFDPNANNFQPTQSNFHDNIAGDGGAGFGGAIYCMGKVDIKNAYFHQNRGYSGAAVYVYNNGEEDQITNSLFAYGIGSFGGAVYAHSEEKTTLNGKFLSRYNVYKLNNSNRGGAVYTDVPVSDFQNDKFDSNIARGGSSDPYGEGGAIYQENGTIEKNGQFYNGSLYVGNLPGFDCSFTNNTAAGGNGTGSAICALGQVFIQNNTFTGNMAGKKDTPNNIIPGATIAVGTWHWDTGTITGNTISDNKGQITIDNTEYNITSDVIGFHNHWGTEAEPVVNLLISKNTIQDARYGVNVPAYVKQVNVTQNTFSKNVENIHNGQHTPRIPASNNNLSTKGNLGIGKPLFLSATSGTSITLSAAITQGLTTASKFEVYGKNNTGVFNYLGDFNPSQTEVDNSMINNKSIILTNAFNATDSLFLVAIDASGNTSEMSAYGIPLTIKIKDVARSEIPWPTSTIMEEVDPEVFSLYGGPERINKVVSDTIGTFYVVKGPSRQFAVYTPDSKHFGAWSFHGSIGETVNMETYRVVQNYNFDAPLVSNAIKNDFKLLAIVDGTTANPLRNNYYFSMGNNGTGNEGGGGGLIIKRTTPDDVDPVVTNGITLNSTVKPIGGTSGTLNAGFVVVDKDADFIVDGATLNMTSHNGTSLPYGPRLVIEKDFETCGIFALENNGTIASDANFMALYHHVMNPSKWSWLGFETPVSSATNLLYTASSASDQFKINDSTEPNLVVAHYNQQTRSSTKPQFGSDGNAWMDGLSENNYGFIVSLNDNSSPKDLYNSVIYNKFQNSQASESVYFNACTVAGQKEAAKKYLGNGATDADAQNLANLYHSGWNLISNPYSKSWIPDASIGGVVAMPSGDSYSYWNLNNTIVLGLNSKNGVISEFPGTPDNAFNIPPLTSFFVQYIGTENGNASLDIPQNFSWDNQLRSSSEEPGIIRITLLKDDKPVSQAVLSLSPGATTAMDKGLDVPLMGSTGTDVYLPDKMGFAMVINAIDKNSNEFTAPIGINLDKAGQYKFRISEIKNVSDDLTLKDFNKETPVREGDVYSFTVDSKGKLENRFSIGGKKTTTHIDHTDPKDNPYAYVANKIITINNLSGQADIALIDMSGKMLYRTQTKSENSYSLPEQSSGSYIIRILQDKQSYRFKIIIH